MKNKITVSAPGRIDLSGGATDWCGLHTLAMAINLRAYADISLLDNPEQVTIQIGNVQETYDKPEYGTELDLFKACIELTGLRGFKVNYRTDIPKGSGLGGSAPLTVATVFGLNYLFKKGWSKYYIAELAQRAESLKLHTVNGYQDQYTAAFGGLIFMDFAGKACQKGRYSKPIDQEPYAVVENLTAFMPDMYVLVVIPRIARSNSNQTNGSLSERYLNGESKIVELIKEKARITQEAKKTLIDGNIAKLYEIINRNNEIMKEFGFLSEYNLEIAQISRKNGALAVKTCGAGRAAMAIFAESQQQRDFLQKKITGSAITTFQVSLTDGVKIAE